MIDKEGVESLIVEHYDRRPLMRATDLYKLLYQGVFGVGHIMDEGALDWLRAEAEKLDIEENPDEPLLEDISADGKIVRVNLRPYLRRGLPLEGLFEAMKETSRLDGSKEEFMDAWDVLKALVASGRLEVDIGEFKWLDEELQREGCRPHHHSEAYRNEYRPAYRVVTRESLSGVL